MHVLHLTRDFPPRMTGGLSTAVGGLVEALAPLGVRSSVISFDAWRPRSASQTAPPQRDGQVLRVTSPSHDAAIRAFIEEADADVMHVHDGMLWPYAAGATTTVFTVHVAHATLRRLRGLPTPTQSETAQAQAIAEADVVTVASAAMLDVLERAGTIVPFGMHPPQPVAQARRGALFAARLADIKGIGELMDAVGMLERPLDVRIAAGLPENRKAERRLRRRYERDGVTWLGWLGPEQLQREYAQASILVAPSWHETYGFSVLEAMAHGVAVIATDVAGHAELIAHARTGWLVPPRDARALAAAMDRLGGDPTLARELGGAAVVEVHDRRAWSVVAPRWLEVYR